jgi:hypothetical protein
MGSEESVKPEKKRFGRIWPVWAIWNEAMQRLEHKYYCPEQGRYILIGITWPI